MKIEFSHGFRSKVYLATREQRKLFPTAQLVKEDVARERSWFARAYYQHKICKLLFPANFIEVSGSQVDPPDEWDIEEYKFDGKLISRTYVPRIHMIYSKQAELLDDHAKFSAHMTKASAGIGKASVCDCEDCYHHRDFHRELHLKDQAKKLSEQAVKIGIGLPDDDPSDYCLTENGIIFFEIDMIVVPELREYLLSLREPSFDQRYALRLLNRYEALLAVASDDEKKKYADIHTS